MRSVLLGASLVLATLMLVNAKAVAGEGQLPGLKRQSAQFRAAAAIVASASVSIETARGPRQTFAWAQLQSKGREAKVSESGSGTGIIIDSRGYVLTCCHVVAGADAITIKLSTGQKCKVCEVFTDPITDLAVLKVDGATDLPVASFGDSDDVQLGDWVLSVTSPYGLKGSISAGIVSAVDRKLPEMPKARFIQTDAASNPGSSGGPLINLTGEIIGICEGSYGASEGFHGISFAIPANVAKHIAKELIASGSVRRGFLGCASQSLTSDLAKSLGIPDASGVILTEVTADGPAAIAGFRIGDVITHFAGIRLRTGDDMQNAVEQARPGRTYSIELLRDSKRLTFTITPQEMPVSANRERSIESEAHTVPGSYDPVLGLEVDEISTEIAAKLGYLDVEGVLVTQVNPGTRAYDNELAAGMVIQRLGNNRIRNLQEYRDAIRALSRTSKLVALVTTPEGSEYVVFNLSEPPTVQPRSNDKGN